MSGLPEVNLSRIEAAVLGLITGQVARAYSALPVRLEGEALIVAVVDPADTRTLRAIQFATDRKVVAVAVPEVALKAAIEKHYFARTGAHPAPAVVSPPPKAASPKAASPKAVSAPVLDIDLGLDSIGDFAIDDLPTPTVPIPRGSVPAPPPPPSAKPSPAPPSQAKPPGKVDPALLEKPDPAALALVSADTARNFHAMPLAIVNDSVIVAFAAPPDAKSLRAVQFAAGKAINVVIAPAPALEAAILRAYPARAPKAPARTHDVTTVDPSFLDKLPDDIIRILRVDVARKHKAVPIEKIGRRLTIIMADPNDLQALQDLEFVSGMTVKAVTTDPLALEAAVERYYPPSTSVQADRILAAADMAELDAVEVVDEAEDGIAIQMLDDGDEAPAVKLTNMLVKEAVGRGASDIHIESYETFMRVRYRIDGVLYEVAHPPLGMRDPLISRLKVMSKMDISERRMPQDGRIKLKMRDGTRVKPLDFRVSVLPTIWGEKVVLRILDPDKLMLDLTKLGFDPASQARFERAISMPYGMVLVVGPSGCGKTNTLYSAMSSINNNEVNIMTAEDPVEFNIRGINQVQTIEAIGLSFAASLRSFLRQDPNIILVGEIRDFETAEIAVKASLTGHLVLSTLHTTDAPTTVSRLINMGVEPFLVATSLLLISAQRLVRRVCTNCAEPDPRDQAELLDIGFRPDDLPVKSMKGRGCQTCHMTGYKGRAALFEVMEISDPIKELVLQGATPTELKAVARSEGMLTLRDSGLKKIKEGITSVDEVTRETMK